MTHFISKNRSCTFYRIFGDILEQKFNYFVDRWVSMATRIVKKKGCHELPRLTSVIEQGQKWSYKETCFYCKIHASYLVN